MTRFARAKGSKSSNERVPDEATPWNVMKMQLEDSQASSKTNLKKAKTAKELLAEKDELFYHDATGNVNHEWATFDDVSEKKSDKSKSGKLNEIKKNKKDNKKIKNAAKLLLSNDSTNDEIVKIVRKVQNEDQNDSQANAELETSQCGDKIESKTKKKRKNISNSSNGVELDSEKLAEQYNTVENKTNDSNINLNSNDTLSNEKSDLKTKKSKKESKKSKSGIDSGQLSNEPENVTLESQSFQKIELATAESDKKEGLSLNAEGSSERLSKRQKRNQKKQRKIMSEKNESKVNVENEESEKVKTPKGFDVLGNEWSNEVKFGKQSNLHQLSARLNTKGDSEVHNDKEKEKLNRKNVNAEKEGESDEAQNGNSKTKEEDKTQNKKNQKRKNGKNDNKEYKRRKPDEGVVKMIINGNEIEVVKYDGFPVKKEDADRLQELKKNMIIKGIPRSEINIAMKLERRKAEKALARERKRVCFHCRRSGHNLSDCPELGRDESGTGICFKCGSAEHTHFECKVVKGQEFRHASCFICREQGHIAKQCPDNPKGLYPQGGSCKICGDVTHLKKDCPDVIKEKEETNITADKIVGNQLESLEEDKTNTKNEIDNTKPKNKITKF